jgi:hypothetical protein
LPGDKGTQRQFHLTDNNRQSFMRFVRPKIIGTLKIQRMMAGNLSVINDIKNAPNKIRIVCDSLEHGEEIIKILKESKPGDILHF